LLKTADLVAKGKKGTKSVTSNVMSGHIYLWAYTSKYIWFVHVDPQVKFTMKAGLEVMAKGNDQ